MSYLPPSINIAKLARDLASDIFEPAQIAKSHGITMPQLEDIMGLPEFQKTLRSMVEDWNSAANTPERIKVKAQTAVEVAIEVFFDDMRDRGIPLVQRVEALKAMMKLGSLAERDLIGGGGALGGVTININTGTPGEGRPPKIITVEAVPVVDQLVDHMVDEEDEA
jgi:hypothetical protein